MGNLIYVIGFGPGDEKYFTAQAREAIETSDVIIGYSLYVELIKNIYPDKEYMSTGMKHEIERCQMCVEEAKKGRIVSLVCSGDAGIYGMASPLLEVATDDIEIVVVPGITAASSGAAILGAPINHDFCVISLSDLLTPWEIIEKRLRAAVQGDFAIAIYNPSSHKRKDYLKRALEIMLEEGATRQRICGYVENIGREDENYRILTLGELKETEVNMFTTVFVGNSMTYEKNGKMITKRGYK